MLCDNCKERDAIINLTQVEHDSKVTLHLCEQCAQQKGVETGGAVMKSPLGNFLGALGKGAALVPAAADSVRCPACGSTLRDFRESGRLGCDQCYAAFDAHLRDLLRRLHGSSQHVGERYAAPGEGRAVEVGVGTDAAGAGAGSDPRSRLLELKAQLRRAVEGENFELAAELRDRIRVLE